MSESIPRYVSCASGYNVFTDCLLMRAGNLIRLIGHAQMDFTHGDAKRLADYILDLLDHPDRKVAPLAVIPEGANSSGDAIVEAVRDRLLARSVVGQRKYGATMARQDLDTLDWIRHAQEEALDMAVYLERLHQDLQQMIDDGR